VLPDFLTLKLELSKSQSYTVTHDRSGEPLLSKIASHVNHEGKGFILMREDGTQETIDFQKTIAEIRIDLKDMQSKGEAAIDEALNSANKQIHETQKKMLFETLNRTVPAHDAGGKPLSAELILDTWNTMDFSFDENGNWQRPELVINPIQAPRLTKELKRLETEPELILRFEELLARKKTDWHDREANRKLVD
jgi:hypothetical protein